MKIIESLLKCNRRKMKKDYDKDLICFVIDKLKPWIVLNCLKKENYIITDNQAEKLCLIIIKQAISYDVFDKVIQKIGLEV